LAINGYFIVSHWWLFYWRLLVVIVLQIIVGYSML
jgi:hypothetical protein